MAKKNQSTGVRLGDVDNRKEVERTDLPEYINSSELSLIPTFTIYGGFKKLLGGEKKISFQVAYKVEGEIQKKVYTVNENEDRLAVLQLVLQNKAITNCKLIKLYLGKSFTYWKIVDADAPLPSEAAIPEAPQDINDDEIPF